MLLFLKLLSVFVVMAHCVPPAKADSFSLFVKAAVCEDKTPKATWAETRYKAYDKAALLAVKSSPRIQQSAASLDDYSFTELSYRLADNALRNVVVATTEETDKKICLNLSGELDPEVTEKLLAKNTPKALDENKIKKIAREINTIGTNSKSKAGRQMLVYIKDLEFYNQKTSSTYTQKIAEQLSFEPEILVTDSKELADVFLKPQLVRSEMEQIDAKHSRYAMSVEIRLEKADGTLLAKKSQNRYVIIEASENTQDIAAKLLHKLLEDAVSALSEDLKTLKSETFN